MTPRERPSENGWIEGITGCMFSGKTSELLERTNRAELSGHEVKLFKPAVDDRYGETEIGSYNGDKRKAEVVEDASEIDSKAYVIGIDEANFFDEKLVEKAGELADRGHRVIISGLDTDFSPSPLTPFHS